MVGNGHAGARGMPGGVTASIKRWDPSAMKNDRILILVGRRGSGKSKLMADTLYNMRDAFDFGIAFSPTEESARFFRRHMPEACFYSDYDESRLASLLEAQTKDARKHGECRRKCFCVMDDCMFDKRVLKSLAMRDLFMNGRHKKTFFLNAMQYVMDMSPDLRSQCDYVMALKENILSNKQRLYRYFFGMFDTYEEFARVFDACTQNYEALVLDNTSPSTDFRDNVFWYKAQVDLPEFKLCRPMIWKLAESYRRVETPGATAPTDHEDPRKVKILAVQKVGISGEALCDRNAPACVRIVP